MSLHSNDGNHIYYRGMRIPITSIESVLKFLHGMYNDGLCSGLSAARSALASTVTIKMFAKLSDHPLLVRYLKGIFNRHPPLPRYMHLWGINLVLTCMTGSDIIKN